MHLHYTSHDSGFSLKVWELEKLVEREGGGETESKEEAERNGERREQGGEIEGKQDTSVVQMTEFAVSLKTGLL